MSINNTDLYLCQLQSQVNSITSTCDAKDFFLLANSVAEATDHRQVTVATVSSLPNLFQAGIPNGFMVYVQEIDVPVIAWNESWIGLDGRVLRSDAATRTLFTWGINSSGQLGDGTTIGKCSPGTVAGGGTTWCNASGFYSRAAVKTDGTLWTWGTNVNGQLGDGTTTGKSSPGTIVNSSTNWSSVYMSNGFVTALKNDGTLWTWGSNSLGQLGDGTATARCSPGTVAGGGTNWCQIFNTLGVFAGAIKTDGTLWTWGCNNCGQLGDGTTVNRCSPGTVAGGGTNWCRVFSGRYQIGAIKGDGTLWTWGRNNFGQLGDGTTVNRCSPGTVAGGGGTAWCQGSGTRYSTAVVKIDGTLWTWGLNDIGQLGNGTTVSRCSPGTVAGGGTTWCQVSGVDASIFSLKTDGTLWTWGSNSGGSLGDGTTVNKCSPGTVVNAGTTWVFVDRGVALKSQ